MKRLRREKESIDVEHISNDEREPSILGKRLREFTEDNEECENELDSCSRTL